MGLKHCNHNADAAATKSKFNETEKEIEKES